MPLAAEQRPAPSRSPSTPARRDAVRLASGVSEGALVERLIRMRTACQALAFELAGTRRELRAVELELRRLKRRYGAE
ncbi:MAG: hypothetical protein GXY03_09840 [Solirubrobacterales bacterium]|nr:hypothetical protein [Solirubrobacterales bacterium]